MKLTNNDVLRRLRFIFEFDDNTMIKLFGLAQLKVTRSMVSNWLKRDDVPTFCPCNDLTLATFLNGLIISKRGRKDGVQPEPEQHLTNNIIFRKLKIALELKNDDIIAIMQQADFHLSKHELTAFFRKSGHKNYRRCKDQIMRNFLTGLQLKYHHLKQTVNAEHE